MEIQQNIATNPFCYDCSFFCFSRWNLAIITFSKVLWQFYQLSKHSSLQFPSIHCFLKILSFICAYIVCWQPFCSNKINMVLSEKPGAGEKKPQRFDNVCPQYVHLSFYLELLTLERNCAFSNLVNKTLSLGFMTIILMY